MRFFLGLLGRWGGWALCVFSFSGDGDDWMMTSRQAGEAVRVLLVDGC